MASTKLRSIKSEIVSSSKRLEMQITMKCMGLEGVDQYVLFGGWWIRVFSDWINFESWLWSFFLALLYKRLRANVSAFELWNLESLPFFPIMVHFMLNLSPLCSKRHTFSLVYIYLIELNEMIWCCRFCTK